jgi:TATA-box binding protein (TBP), component of TFIID and TFIIIB
VDVVPKDKKSEKTIKKEVKKKQEKVLSSKVEALPLDAYKEVTVPPIKIQNIVVSADLHAVIDLFNLSKEVKAVDYEPEQFPGAIFKVEEPKAVLILFKNGKMICTGASKESDIRKVLEYAAKVISKYVLEVPSEDKQAPKTK